MLVHDATADGIWLCSVQVQVLPVEVVVDVSDDVDNVNGTVADDVVDTVADAVVEVAVTVVDIVDVLTVVIQFRSAFCDTFSWPATEQEETRSLFSR